MAAGMGVGDGRMDSRDRDGVFEFQNNYYQRSWGNHPDNHTYDNNRYVSIRDLTILTLSVFNTKERSGILWATVILDRNLMHISFIYVFLKDINHIYDNYSQQSQNDGNDLKRGGDRNDSRYFGMIMHCIFGYFMSFRNALLAGSIYLCWIYRARVCNC
jgi:hypothetical protein